MGLGFSKSFAIVLLLAAATSYYLRDWKGGLPIIIIYAVIKIIWNVMTK